MPGRGAEEVQEVMPGRGAEEVQEVQKRCRGGAGGAEEVQEVQERCKRCRRGARGARGAWCMEMSYKGLLSYKGKRHDDR
eukprot:1159017-Pelagomonas_calceolata.AAC.7